MNPVLALARPDILELQPDQHAKWDPSLERMHANEMPWRAQGDNTQAGLNRYPEPQPRALVERMAKLYGVPAANCLVGRGSDEAIDLLVRAFCRAGQDSVVITPPTFGFYKVAARIQGASVIEVPLLPGDFSLDLPAVLEAGRRAKIVFLCVANWRIGRSSAWTRPTSSSPPARASPSGWPTSRTSSCCAPCRRPMPSPALDSAPWSRARTLCCC
jgi:histidinol-phosphate aminotransferase